MEGYIDRTRAVLQHFLSIHEADSVDYMLFNEDEYTTDDIIEYIEWCRKRYERHLDTEFDSWLEDRKRRVQIEILVTEGKCRIHEELEFPKRGEDMEYGTEFEWYYSLRAVTDEIMALPVGGSMNFKIRDDKDSHGVVIRTA